MWVTHKHSRSVHTLVVVLCTLFKIFLCLKTGNKRINIVTYHAVTILGDYAVWPGVVSSDGRRSDLVNRHNKKRHCYFQSFD